ncbi:FAD-dependent monooxygenase [Saccharothrix sp. BKS2]|uniref:FAD-dependent monooxygenase n=1 Tax=Saccharothrix sp. BKS2 TaxID=3064400 RepID=UPI0039E96DE7
MRAKVGAVVGTDFGMRDPSWLSRFGSASRLADRYREGRLLLAGDAAHQHFPAGGVGLNVGVQDAAHPGVSAELAGWLSGLAVAYPAGAGDHPLTGCRAPDVGGLFAALRSDRYVLLDFGGEPVGVADADPGAGGPGLAVLRGVVGEGRPGWTDVRAALIRPDGHVAWADHPGDDLPVAVRAALSAIGR